MKTGFKPNTLGEAFVLKIKKDYDDDMESANPIGVAPGEHLYTDVLPFRGIEQVNSELAENWQYMDIPVRYSRLDNSYFDFPSDFDWDKYAPDDIEERYNALGWYDFRDFFTGVILPFYDPLIIVKARNRLYALCRYDLGDYSICSYEKQKFVNRVKDSAKSGVVQHG